ncbi:MAG: type II toxin-antitoxin system HicB family antitoxin [Methyloceanibacter sp.]
MMRDDKSVVGASSSWVEMPKRKYEYREDQSKAGGTRSKIAVTVRRLPENVYLAISEDVPGMTVEGRTRDEVVEEARDVAINLLELSGKHVEQEELSFVFVFYD